MAVPMPITTPATAIACTIGNASAWGQNGSQAGPTPRAWS